MTVAAPPRTDRSGSKLSDVARHLVMPSGVVTTAWPSVARQLKRIEIPLDPWQEGLCTAALGKRADGMYAAGVGGVVISIPRQVGKTYTIGALVFALALANPNMLIVWTAHRTRTHGETFEAMTGMAEMPRVKPLVENVRRVNGEQEIKFTNGSRILFGARERGFGRGFAQVDLLVFDEAQILTERAMEDMVPATNAAPNGLVVMIGTPPRPIDPGEIFRMRRDAALSGEDEDTLYIELSADEKASLDDRGQWRKANPSFPRRVGEAAILRMRKLLGSDEAFKREGLGIWDEKATGKRAFSKGVWESCGADAPDDGVKCFGVKFSADGAHVALGGAIKTAGGLVHIEAIRQTPMSEGTQWLVDFLVDRKDSTAQIVVDGRAGVGYLVQALRDDKVPAKMILVPTVDQAITAHSMLDRAVTQSEVTHSSQPELEAQVDIAVRREIGKAGGFGWESSIEGESVALLDAVTLAHYGAKVTKRKPGRKAVFM